MKKRIIKGLILLVAAGLLVAASIMGTLAYLTSSSSVSNVFTVGNVGIQMFEHKVTSDGKFVDGNTETGAFTNATPLVDTNSYHLQPDGEYKKDPFIRIHAGSDESYLFVKIRNDLRNVEANPDTIMNDGTTEYESLSEQVARHGWYFIGRTSNANVYVYENFVGNNTENVDIQIFDHFKIDPKADLSTHGASIVTLFGFAIQTTGFKPDGATAVTNDQAGLDAARDAWTAIGTEYVMQDTHLVDEEDPFIKGDNNYGTNP